MKKVIFLLFLMVAQCSHAQWTPWGLGLIQKPNAQSARAYLGITVYTNGAGVTFTVLPSGLTQISFTGSGSGTVTSFSAGGLSPLFTSSVATATTTPALTFAAVAQSANKLYAGPTSGGAVAPTFRSLVSGDIPALAYVSSVDLTMPSIFTVTGNPVTSSGTLAVTLANESANTFWTGPSSGSPAAPTFRTVSIDEMNDVTITAPAAGDIIAWNGSTFTNGPPTGGGGGGGGSSIDLPIQAISPTTGTNFNVDFQYPAQYLNATGAIAFNSSANIGNANTSRIARIFVQSTNYARKVFFLNESTNWHIAKTPYVIPAGMGCNFVAEAFGGQSTNIQMTFSLDDIALTNALTYFDYNTVTGLKLYIDASRVPGVWQDFNMVVPAQDGSEIRGLTDWSGTGNHLTNNAAATMTAIYQTSHSGPFGIPCIAIRTGSAGTSALNSKSFTALSQVNWVFIVYWSLRGSNPVFDSQSTAARISCDPGNYSGAGTLQLFCGTSLTTVAPTNSYWTLYSFKCNGASSIIRTNGVQAVTGNAGAGAPTGFRLGADATPNAVTTASFVAKLLMYNADLSNGDRDNIENGLMNEYGISH